MFFFLQCRSNLVPVNETVINIDIRSPDVYAHSNHLATVDRTKWRPIFNFSLRVFGKRLPRNGKTEQRGWCMLLCSRCEIELLLSIC